ncbi:hypothetical protein BSF38_02824 [Paludisphaera borealis]|uniref:Uncharacterized protein n=2 Tax=Paludisphaera borealis TaxID=1387353 RepID=A0A1U7CQU0_9BACT|nr:hypothetical protein BSF38_02824 [Paludisphaera borealis]
MKRPFAVGDLVSFQLTTGRASEGIVIHKIVEKRQPTIFLIECGDQRRAFRFEAELALLAPAEAPEAGAMRVSGFEPAMSVSASAPAFAAQGADD